MEDKLQKAPLIEAIFELRWRPVVGDRNEDFPSRHHAYDLSSFLFTLAHCLREAGFSYTEHLTPEFTPPIAHQLRTRYRQEKSSYPCIQIGDGIFTVNQINDEYKWGTFKSTILDALEIFARARDENRPLVEPRASLQYIDGISTDNFSEFIAEETRLVAEVEPELEGALEGLEKLQCQSVSFGSELTNPAGSHLFISAEPTLVNDQKSALIRYQIGGPLDGAPLSTGTEEITAWLETAHKVLHNSFVETFTKNAYERRFL